MQLTEWDSVSIKKVDEVVGACTSAFNFRLTSVRNYMEFNPVFGCTANSCKTIYNPLIELPHSV